MPQPRKKLIEVSLPLDAINAASRRTKTKAPKGYPTSFHKYWAHRPLAACRAVIFAQLVDDPSSWPERFPTGASQDVERERLHEVIREFVEWPKSTADQTRWEKSLDAARFEIARSVAWARNEEPPTSRSDILAYLAANAPAVNDPFCGGGSIPLEAQRLGLRAQGSDLNPVPVLISRALVEIPPKFTGLPPVNPDVTRDLLDATWKGAAGLAADVRYYGRWMRAEAAKRIGHVYPDVALPSGGKASVVAWLWARTVASPDPAAKGAMVPLASSFILSSKPGRETIARVVRDGNAQDGWRFEVQQGQVSAADLAIAKKGTVNRSEGGRCALTGAPMPFSYLRAEGGARRLGVRLMAIVAEGTRGRTYLTPTDDQERAARVPRPSVDAVPISHWPGRTNVVEYGMTEFADLFTDRQLSTLVTMSDLVMEARAKALVDARGGFATRSHSTDERPLSEGGRGALAYADALATYLAFVVDRMAEYGSSGASWLPKDSAIRSALARQALPMVWDYCEANYFSKSSAGIETCISVVADALECAPATSNAFISQWAAQNNNFDQRIVFSTDPPYYDNIAYADLYDFFYHWLRRSLAGVWPELFRRIQTPKEEELIASPYRHGGKDAAELHFMNGMGQALAAMARASEPSVPMAIYYAFKQSEKSEDGIGSAGWASFLQAVIASGLMVDGTWPMRTENEERLIGNNSNMLASSIVLVCRPRSAEAHSTTRRDFVAELRRELPEALARMRAAGMHPVDMPQSALGPGMAVFSKYAVVREADDSAMSVSRAITLINQVRGEIAHADSGELDAPTRFALDWFEAYGWGAKGAGEAIKLAQSYDLTERGLRDAGVLVTDRGDARLVRRSELPPEWRPSRDRSLTAWELVQALNRALNDGGGINAAGELLGKARELGSAALWLTERLFALSEDRRMADEAIGWGRLAEAWDAIESAADRADGPAVAITQPDLL
jgi:putative DNA methylase